MEDLTPLIHSAAYVLLGLATLLIAKLVLDALTPFKVDEELTTKDNPALGVTVCGYLIAVIAIFLGATVGDTTELGGELDGELASLGQSLGIDFGYAIGGILLLNVGRALLDRLVLSKFSTRKEIIEDRNVGTGAVEFGNYIATGLIIAGSISGEGGGPLTALVYFGLGQAVLVLFGWFYQLITKYDVHAEIEKDNVAAGVAMGLSMIAIGIILLRAIAGDFSSFAEDLPFFGYFTIAGFALLWVMRKIVDFVFLPGTTLAHEIVNDRNLNVAWIEGTMTIGVAVIIFFML